MHSSRQFFFNFPSHYRWKFCHFQTLFPIHNARTAMFRLLDPSKQFLPQLQPDLVICRIMDQIIQLIWIRPQIIEEIIRIQIRCCTSTSILIRCIDRIQILPGSDTSANTAR